MTKPKELMPNLCLDGLDWSTVTGIEIHGTEDVYEGAEYVKSRTNENNPEYYSVYLTQKKDDFRFTSWISDSEILDKAKEDATKLAEEHDLPVHVFPEDVEEECLF